EHNSKPENRDSENIYISGDNLDALKHLCKSYAGQVKCIYIDPPYNTGSDGFVYNDKFSFDAQSLSSKLGISLEQAEHILDMKKTSSTSDAAWLTFMLPRLELAKDMLTKDGVIFISIDDNEQASLKLLCDEIFGVENFIGQIIWKNATDNNPTNIACEHEYILCYSRNKELIESAWKSNISAIKDLLIEKGKELNSLYKGDLLQKEWKNWYRNHKDQLGPFADYKFIDEGGVFTGSRSVHNPGKDGYNYDIIHPITKKPCTPPLMGYRFPQTSMQKLIDEGRILFGEDETKLVEIKVYASEYQDKLSSVYVSDGRTGANELRKLFPEYKQIFKNPKSTDLIEHLLSFINLDNCYVMDYFGGSSTTAQSLYQMNAMDNGHRKYIMVQWQEPCKPDSEAAKAGYKTIDEVGQERIRRAAKKIAEANPLFKGDLGFKHYTLEDFEGDTIDRLYDFDMNAELNGNDLLAKFGPKTVLTTWLCRDGYGLNAKVTEVKLNDYTAYLCGKHLYLLDANFYQDEMACLIDKMADASQQFNPDVIVVFGYGMGYSTRLMLDKNLHALAEARGNKISLDVRY
nr:site-specific DNA-methyltransferase [Bacteroidaceae bacterium]